MTTVNGPDQVGGTMQVDTGEFRALRDQVSELAELVRRLGAREATDEAFFAAGRAFGETQTREALLGRAAETSRVPRHRPSHLRAIRNDES